LSRFDDDAEEIGCGTAAEVLTYSAAAEELTNGTAEVLRCGIAAVE